MTSTVCGVSEPNEVLDLVLRVFKDAMECGLIEIGDVTEQGFRSWGLTPTETCERIRKEWMQFPGGPRLGDMSCWVNATSKD